MFDGMEFDWSMGTGEGVPPGVYLAEYVGHEPGENENGRFFRFGFKVLAGPQAGQKTSCMADAGRRPSPKNKLGRVLNGLAGRTLAGGESFHPDLAKGKSYTIVVTQGPNGGGTRVDNILPSQQPQ
jgi:hypothetical protein